MTTDAKVATNIAKPWHPWKRAALVPIGSLASLPFFTTYKAIKTYAKPWHPWLAPLAVFGPVWQPSRSRLQGCQQVLGGGSVGRVGSGDLAEHGANQHGGVGDTKSTKENDATYILARLRRDK